MTDADRPSFVLKFKLKGRPNRARPDVVLERSRVVVGSRPLADVYVADRLVAQEALALTFDGTRLTLDVLDDLSGVFVDGTPVSGHGAIHHGATIQVGHALVEVAIDAQTRTCTLTTSELYLAAMVDGVVKRSRPERPFELHPSGPQEHRWGKQPFLRRANWTALVLGVVALAAVPLLRNTEALSRGELAAQHRIGSHDDGPQSCADCHSPFSSDYASRCAECHEGTSSSQFHPYEQVERFTCSACHADHRGADADLVPVLGRDPSSGWSRLCSRCHGVMDTNEHRPRALKDSAGEPAERWLHVDGFSHRDHRVTEARSRIATVPVAPTDGKVPVDCAECHRRSLGVEPPTPTAEFALVPYERCLDCHADWSVPVHGRDQHGAACFACHEKTAALVAAPEDITAALRTVELPRTMSRYVLQPRDHDYSAEECRTCHVLGKDPGDRRIDLAEQTFRHDHHLPAVTVPTGTGLVYSEQCMDCHSSVAGSDSLADASIVDTSGCATCHTGGEPVAVEVNTGGSRTVTDMFHRVHTVRPGPGGTGATRSLAQGGKLARGCVSCHVPVQGTGRMAFREGAQDCSACHTRHANIGQGKCVLCHVDRGYDGNRDAAGDLQFVYQEAGIYDREKAVMKETAALPKFDHFSRGHDGEPCAICHDEQRVDRSERVLTVPWPAHDAPACVACHMKERYHR